MTRPKRTIWFLILATAMTSAKLGLQILLSCWTTFIALLLVLLVLGDMVKDLQYAGFRAKALLFGDSSKPVGIYRADDRTGWSHLPGTRGQASHFAFDVEYNIDGKGYRVIKIPARPRF